MSNTNGPKYHVFTSEKGKDDKNYYTKVGAAWPLKDRDGLSIKLEALPVNGELVLFPPKAKDASE